MNKKLRLPIVLVVDPRTEFKLLGQLEIAIRVRGDMLQLAMLNGYEAEEIQNIVGQKLAAVNDLIVDLTDAI